MRVFLTGAGGYIGSALAARLHAEGHEVVGLTRDARKAERMRAAGWEAVVGDMKRPGGWRREADSCEALVHLGFEYGPSAADADRRALTALSASARSARAPRVLIYTSGVWVLGPSGGGAATEESLPNPAEVVRWRPEMERSALDAAGRGVSAVVIRPGRVYGGGGGLYGAIFDAIMTEREVRLPGDGLNRWAGVYLDDLADLYVRVLTHRPRREIYHAVDGAADTARATAEAFAAAAGGADVEDWPLDEARRSLGPVADALAMDQRVSAEKARRQLGWAPKVVSAARNAAELIEEWGARTAPPCVA